MAHAPHPSPATGQSQQAARRTSGLFRHAPARYAFHRRAEQGRPC
ncbi:hypothetical protein roselon_00310 [Roseibacterium elongatum DSM 19469]|uniref:Uncharacterized protein n=1 Tax=Roseicyclus elongatus DSM 19469 TaxID=1294273 RepID=W8RP24_9RHOB|nr:hypothetical protein roselon_00310 [Roseibacterium elongatum DSM 19469]